VVRVAKGTKEREEGAKKEAKGGAKGAFY